MTGVTVLIPVFNAMPWFKRCVESVLLQDYAFNIVIMDDHSTDGTWEYARAHSAVYPHIKALRTSEYNRSAFPTTIEALGRLDLNDDHVVVILDGDDWLLRTGAIRRVALEYTQGSCNDPGIAPEDRVWMTYGQYACIRNGRKVGGMVCAATPDNMIDALEGPRHFARQRRGLPYGPLKTFYYGLFRHIPPRYLLKPDGSSWGAGGDSVMMMSLFELARRHARFIPDELYAYNIDNPLHDNKRYPGEQARVWNLFVTNYEPLRGIESPWHDKEDSV